MIKNITIFDLDGTCIDSSHRQLTKADGTLDIANWLENATSEKVFKDSLLPLASEISKRKIAGDYTIISTARNMTDADFEFLRINNMVPNLIISRKVGDNRPDDELKFKRLSSLFNLKQFRNANKIMFDDAKSVRATLRGLLDAVINPAKINERLI
tara:strand:- start:164 stop:631 length:468 start_codon:yes stop_codon:yes gene_type:complete